MFKYLRIVSINLACLIFLFAAAMGMDLRTAKSQGLVGETTSGYLAAVKPGNAEAEQLVSSINSQRRAEYQQIAARNQTTLQAVEQLAGKQAIEKTPAGQYIQINGSWRKK